MSDDRRGTLRFDDVGLDRRATAVGGGDLKSAVFSLLGGRSRRPVFRTILDGIDLTVERGEKIGLIGPNGAGKSTLLKLACGVFEPTRGRVVASGSVAPLLELGAGFDPYLAVAENVVLYGVLLGRTRAEAISRTEAILDFAELEEFREYPVRALSSGMTARLGFAIATDVAPDILLVDEVLSVGDERFRRKASQRLEALWRIETTVLLVSHDLEYVKANCDRVIWLRGGRVVADGPAREAISAYTRAVDDDAVALLARVRAGRSG